MAKIVRRHPVTANAVPEGATCKQLLRDRYGYAFQHQTCERPATVMAYPKSHSQEPVPMCNVHKAAKVRIYNNDVARDERDTARRERNERNRAQRTKAIKVAELLSHQLGVPLYAIGSEVGMNLDTAEKLLAPWKDNV